MWLWRVHRVHFFNSLSLSPCLSFFVLWNFSYFRFPFICHFIQGTKNYESAQTAFGIAPFHLSSHYFPFFKFNCAIFKLKMSNIFGKNGNEGGGERECEEGNIKSGNRNYKSRSWNNSGIWKPTFDAHLFFHFSCFVFDQIYDPKTCRKSKEVFELREFFHRTAHMCVTSSVSAVFGCIISSFHSKPLFSSSNLTSPLQYCYMTFLIHSACESFVLK